MEDRFLRIFSVFLIIFLSGHLSVAGAKSLTDEERRTAFLAAWAVFSKAPSRPIDHVTSPFLSLLSPPFETGLEAADRALFEAALKDGDPVVVQRLLVKGFLKLHPFLKPLFDRDQNRTLAGDFRFVFHSNHLPQNAYRGARFSLRDLEKKYGPLQFQPVNLEESAFSNHPLKRADPRETFERTVPFYGLGRLAFCFDDRRAIKDVLGLANQQGGLRVSWSEYVYLLHRGFVQGVVAKKVYQERLAALMAELGVEKVKALVRLAEQGQVSLLPPHGQYWPARCETELALAQQKREE